MNFRPFPKGPDRVCRDTNTPWPNVHSTQTKVHHVAHRIISGPTGLLLHLATEKMFGTIVALSR